MDELTETLTDGVLTLTLNRPEKLNALNANLLNLLAIKLEHAEKNSAVRAVLLIGHGKAFSAGADIHHLATCDAEQGYAFACHGQRVLRQLETLSKPSLAAINGYAFGGGCELAMAATLRIASNQATFAQPEVKLGIIPGYGGTQRLTRLIGKGRALDLCLSGRTLDAETAARWGLVNEVVAADDLLPKAHAILHEIMRWAPLAIQSIMQSIDYGMNLSLTEALHLEAIHFAKVCATKDKMEGVQAFLEKRPPTFRGE